MDLSTLEISPEEARAKLDEYADQLASERTAEDEAILAGYRAAKRGLPVILLTETIAAGGFFANGLPKLAVVRADATQCFVHNETGTWRSGSWFDSKVLIYSDGETRRNNGALLGLHTVRVAIDDLPTRTSYWNPGQDDRADDPAQRPPAAHPPATPSHLVGSRGMGAGATDRPGPDPPYSRRPLGGRIYLGADGSGALCAHPAGASVIIASMSVLSIVVSTATGLRLRRVERPDEP